ncbi:MAG: hypothetical protein LBO71_10640, partial [Prevotellaceae bacterium]|nr:hypothetical protein [Prevotellaceae bacterium]
MKIQKFLPIASCSLLLACSQPIGTVDTAGTIGTAEVATDASAPLHLLKPSYRTPYGIPSQDSIRAALGRVLAYVEKETPTQVIDARTRQPVELRDIDAHSCLQRGA